MKTAEEWVEMLKEGTHKPLSYTKVVKQIQLDAMREGMRRSAEELAKDHGKIHCMECGKEEVNECQLILSAAEQLTEKDL